MTEALEGWNEFNVALAGAAAALVGLLIVAMSVNISRILETTSVPARAASAIASLTAAVTFSLVGLMPAQPLQLLGAEVLVGCAALWAIWTHLLLRTRSEARLRMLSKTGTAVITPLVYTVGGVILLLGIPAGVTLIAVGSILAIIAGVVFAWVALVEILR